MKLLTTGTARRKSIAVPKTNQEKYDKMLLKNKALDLLKDKFNLEITL
jgi:hypothetical protein